MEDDQQFCLRWNNHQSTLIQNFDTLLESGTLVDCTLATEGKYLKAHKVVLSACSPYFEGLLSEHYDKHPVFILKDVKFKELKAMMDYMYRGEVNISQDQLAGLLKAAESLQIKGLSESKTSGSSKTDSRQQKVVPQATAQPTDIPHASSGLTIEKNKVPRQGMAQGSIGDLAEDSASPQIPKGLSSREGSQSPTSRKRKRFRRRSIGDDNSVENHEASNSSDMPQQMGVPALGIAPVADEKAHADSTDSIGGRSALMTQLTKPADEMLQLPLEKPEPNDNLIEPKSEYLEDPEESVEDLTLDDDMNDLNEMEQDNNRAGPSHDPSQHPAGIGAWHVTGDRSNAGGVVGSVAGAPGTTDEVFLAAQEAAQAHRDSQGVQKKSSVVTGGKEIREKRIQVVDRKTLNEEAGRISVGHCENSDRPFVWIPLYCKRNEMARPVTTTRSVDYKLTERERVKGMPVTAADAAPCDSDHGNDKNGRDDNQNRDHRDYHGHDYFHGRDLDLDQDGDWAEEPDWEGDRDRDRDRDQNRDRDKDKDKAHETNDTDSDSETSNRNDVAAGAIDQFTRTLVPDVGRQESDLVVVTDRESKEANVAAAVSERECRRKKDLSVCSIYERNRKKSLVPIYESQRNDAISIMLVEKENERTMNSENSKADVVRADKRNDTGPSTENRERQETRANKQLGACSADYASVSREENSMVIESVRSMAHTANRNRSDSPLLPSQRTLLEGKGEGKVEKKKRKKDEFAKGSTAAVGVGIRNEHEETVRSGKSHDASRQDNSLNSTIVIATPPVPVIRYRRTDTFNDTKNKETDRDSTSATSINKKKRVMSLKQGEPAAGRVVVLASTPNQTAESIRDESYDLLNQSLSTIRKTKRKIPFVFDNSSDTMEIEENRVVGAKSDTRPATLHNEKKKKREGPAASHAVDWSSCSRNEGEKITLQQDISQLDQAAAADLDYDDLPLAKRLMIHDRIGTWVETTCAGARDGSKDASRVISVTGNARKTTITDLSGSRASQYIEDSTSQLPIEPVDCDNLSDGTTIVLTLNEEDVGLSASINSDEEKWENLSLVTPKKSLSGNSASLPLNGWSVTDEWVDTENLNEEVLPFGCSYCDLRFRRKAHATRHMNKNCLKNPNSVTSMKLASGAVAERCMCHYCGRNFKFTKLLAYHWRHECQIYSACDVCNNVLAGGRVTQKHLLVCRRKAAERQRLMKEKEEVNQNASDQVEETAVARPEEQSQVAEEHLGEKVKKGRKMQKGSKGSKAVEGKGKNKKKGSKAGIVEEGAPVEEEIKDESLLEKEFTEPWIIRPRIDDSGQGTSSQAT